MTQPSRYASLYFILGVDNDSNELMMLEFIHHIVEILDRYFGNVCELDLIFNFHKVHMILDEIIMSETFVLNIPLSSQEVIFSPVSDGKIQETSKKTVLRLVAAQDVIIEEATANNTSLLGTDFNKKAVHSL